LARKRTPGRAQSRYACVRNTQGSLSTSSTPQRPVHPVPRPRSSPVRGKQAQRRIRSAPCRRTGCSDPGTRPSPLR
jgi:hypothetical protein